MKNSCQRLFEKLVDVRPEEIRALWLGFVFNFVVLGGYYVLRPIRDEIGAAGGLENLSWMYTGTMIVHAARERALLGARGQDHRGGVSSPSRIVSSSRTWCSSMC